MAISELTPAERGLITAQPVCRLATANADGTVHIVSLCPAVVDGAVYVDLQAAKHTARNLERSPRATVLFDEYSSDWSKLWGVQLRCRADFLEADGEEWAKAWNAMTVRYPQFDAPVAWRPRRIVRLTPERKLSWGLDGGGGS
jgi:hypothetical protein